MFLPLALLRTDALRRGAIFFMVPDSVCEWTFHTRPLVSYQINRQFCGWNRPPLIIRALVRTAIGHMARSR